MNFDSLLDIIKTDLQLPAYHFQAIKTLIDRGGPMSYQAISSWPKSLKQLETKLPFNSYISSSLIQGKDGSAKSILTYKDNVSIETVFIKTKSDHYSICVSCQSGCAMGCAFCATGSMGLIRSLTAEEITDQFLYWRQTIPDIKPKSVVFMGMGEPFANQLEVFKAIHWLNKYYSLGLRHISVSTCGLTQGILSLAKEYPQVNLAISLHSANQKTREQLMPIAKTVDLNTLALSIKKYLKITNRQITLEYLLLDKLNDTKQALDDLIHWTNQFSAQLVHINLISYNQTDSEFNRPSTDKITFVYNYLQKHDLSVTIRKSQGQDIVGACGQLALKSL